MEQQSYYFISIFVSIVGVICVILGYLIYHKLAIRRNRLAEAGKAALKFRSIILEELSGLYPIDQYWDDNQFSRINNSIPKIKSTAVEYKYFLAATRRANFDKAVDDFIKYFRENTPLSVAADDFYPSMRKEGAIGKREQFKHIVENLLSFAEET